MLRTTYHTFIHKKALAHSPELYSTYVPESFNANCETCLRVLLFLKGLSHEIDFKTTVDENGQISALIRAAAGF